VRVGAVCLSSDFTKQELQSSFRSAAMASISILAPSGSPATAYVARAGGSEAKQAPYSACVQPESGQRPRANTQAYLQKATHVYSSEVRHACEQDGRFDDVRIRAVCRGQHCSQVLEHLVQASERRSREGALSVAVRACEHCASTSSPASFIVAGSRPMLKMERCADERKYHAGVTRAPPAHV